MPADRKISVLEQEITVHQPYEAGHPITELEAKVLNQTFAENVGNNVRARIKKALDGGEGAPTLDESLASAQDYANEYAFTEAAAGGGISLTPVEKEARRIASAYLIQKLREPSDQHPQGRKRSDIEKEAFAAEVARVAGTDKVLKLAAKRLKEQSALGDLGGTEEAAAA